MSFWRRARRSLARRFPKTRRAYNWSIARIGHIGAVAKHRVTRVGTSGVWLIGIVSELRRLRKEPGMIVGVDVASLWEPLTGVGWYLYRLLDELADRDDLIIRLFPPTIVASADIPGPVIDLPQGRAIRLMRLEVPPQKVVFAGATIRSLRRVEPILRSIIGCKILFAPNYYLPRSFSLTRRPLVATIHDLGSVQVPWTLSDETLDAMSRKLELSVKKASHLITVSETVKTEVIEQGYGDPRRIHPIHHGPGHLTDVEPGVLPPGTPNRFALHVGTLEPRKNVEMLLLCWKILSERSPDIPILILCGQYGWKSEEIRKSVEDAERDGQVRHLGYVDDRQLAALYRNASVVVFPTLYEGFGLPAVEAQLAGAPLVCSDIPVLRETAGEAALYAPPDSPALFADAVWRLLSDDSLRQNIVRLGQEQVSQLSWARTADQTIEVWHQAAGIATKSSMDSL